MSKLQDKIYNMLPHFLQNVMVTMYNVKSYRNRYSAEYWAFRKEFAECDTWPLPELKQQQLKKAKEFLTYAREKSPYYSDIITNEFLADFDSVEKINRLPFLTKELLRESIDKVVTIPKNEGFVAKTGGTTGISLEVLFNKSDIQARFAFVDNIRSARGYNLGKKTAWFSGKKLLGPSDIRKKRFWKTDYKYNVRYYSTFHIQQENLGSYIKNMMEFQPEYMVGFPSNMYEMAMYGKRKGIDFPPCINGIFTNAETVTPEMREVITSFFKCDIQDQYSSAEGSPFIFECKDGKYHMELQSGIFEVLDNNNAPTNEGRLVVTAFYTHGTPLVRYEIGDVIKLSAQSCTCGNANPTVEYISGRASDYIYSAETGKINGGNLSNCTKGTHGIIKFQVVQDELDEVTARLITDKSVYKKEDEATFLKNMRDRLGNSLKINIDYCDNIPTENSGKFRFIKNNIKDRVM